MDALRWLGLARRAGAVAAGVAGTRKALRADRAHIVLIAADASEGQRRKLDGLLARRSVPVRIWRDRASLGAAIGSPPVSAVAVTGRSFGRKILEAFESDSQDNEVAGQGRL